jgi:hypothetical protein
LTRRWPAEELQAGLPPPDFEAGPQHGVAPVSRKAVRQQQPPNLVEGARRAWTPLTGDLSQAHLERPAVGLHFG